MDENASREISSSLSEGEQNNAGFGSEEHDYAYPEFLLDSSADGYETPVHSRPSDVCISSGYDYTPFRTYSATPSTTLPTPPSTPPPPPSARPALPLHPMDSSTTDREGVEHVDGVPDDPGRVPQKDQSSSPRCGEVPKRWWVATGVAILILFAVAFAVAVYFASWKATTYHDSSTTSSSSTSITHPDFNLTIVQFGTTICYPQRIMTSGINLPTYYNCTEENCCLEQTGDARLELAQKTDIQFWPYFSNQYPRLIQKAGSRLIVRSATPSPPQKSTLQFDGTVLTQEENSSLTYEFLLHSTERWRLILPQTMDVAGDALVQIVAKGNFNFTYIGLWDQYSHLKMTGASTLIVGGRMANFNIMTSSGSVHIDGGTLKLTEPNEQEGDERAFLVKSPLVIEAGATLEVLDVECCVVISPTRILAGQKISINKTGLFGWIDCRSELESGNCVRPWF